LSLETTFQLYRGGQFYKWRKLEYPNVRPYVKQNTLTSMLQWTQWFQLPSCYTHHKTSWQLLLHRNIWIWAIWEQHVCLIK